MGLGCSRLPDGEYKSSRNDSPDPTMFDVMRKSIDYYTPTSKGGQFHLLYKYQKNANPAICESPHTHFPTQVVIRRHPIEYFEEGYSGTHIYAIRFPNGKIQDALANNNKRDREQAPTTSTTITRPATSGSKTLQQQVIPPDFNVDRIFRPALMAAEPKTKTADWVTISDEHQIYVVDTGMTAAQCDQIVAMTEQVCRGQYAAYTYAKQTLGCREFPALAVLCQPAVHTVTHAIVEFSQNNKLALDDREPHMVKYDVTKRERQKLDMHTDKSEWTFLISLSNGCGVDYEGGGTYFECLDATVHIQRGHALVFPGKLRHCGQKITAGLRYLLVGFLVDKSGRLEDPDVLNPIDVIAQQSGS